MSRACHELPAGIEDEAVSREIASQLCCETCNNIIRCKRYFGIFFPLRLTQTPNIFLQHKFQIYGMCTTLHWIRPIRATSISLKLAVNTSVLLVISLSKHKSRARICIYISKTLLNLLQIYIDSGKLRDLLALILFKNCMFSEVYTSSI